MKVNAPKGFTVLELVSVLGIAMLMAVAALATIQGVRRADISTSAARLSAAVRYLYDSAVLNNGTYKLVIDMESGAWWAERVDSTQTCGGAAVLPGEDEEPADEGSGNARKGAGLQNPFDGGLIAAQMLNSGGSADAEGGVAGQGGGLGELAAKAVAARSSADQDPETAAKIRQARARIRDDLLVKTTLPQGIKFKAVMTTHQDEPTDEGTAEVYFFPSGYVERAFIYVSRGEDVYTVETIPLRGTGLIHKTELDPRDLLAFQ